MEVTDKSWRFKHRVNLEYEAGVDEFIKFAVTHADDETCIVCPCRVCKNFESLSPTEVKDHLIEKGIDMTYDPFYLHGEEFERSSEEHTEEHTSHATEDHANNAEIYEMLQATYESNTKAFPSEAKKKSKIEKIMKDADKPLYEGCTKYNKLDAVVALYSLKANSGMSNKYFFDLLKLLKDMLPEDNVIPKSTNSARSLLRKFDLDYQEIHACVNS